MSCGISVSLVSGFLKYHCNLELIPSLLIGMNTLFMFRLMQVPNWMDVVRNAIDILCTILRKTPAIVISRQMAKKALAESILEHTKRSPNRVWIPEDGKRYFFIISSY